MQQNDTEDPTETKTTTNKSQVGTNDYRLTNSNT